MSERERLEIRAEGSLLFSCLAIECHVLSINRIDVYSTAINMNCMDLKEQTGNVTGRLVYIVPVLRLARAAKQNISWAAQISLSGCRLPTLRWAWMMAGCMVWVD